MFAILFFLPRQNVADIELNGQVKAKIKNKQTLNSAKLLPLTLPKILETHRNISAKVSQLFVKALLPNVSHCTVLTSLCNSDVTVVQNNDLVA